MQRGYLLGVFDDSASFCDRARMLFCERRLVGLATPARPKTGSFRVFSGIVKLYILGPRQSCGARRPAIDPRGFDRIIKSPVRSGVTRKQTLPPWITLN